MVQYGRSHGGGDLRPPSYIHIYIYICVCIHDFDHLLALCLDNNDMGFVPVVLDGGGFYTVTFVQGSAGLGCFVG